MRLWLLDMDCLVDWSSIGYSGSPAGSFLLQHMGCWVGYGLLLAHSLLVDWGSSVGSTCPFLLLELGYLVGYLVGLSWKLAKGCPVGLSLLVDMGSVVGCVVDMG
mmetsp:Transcript_44876/g.79001  ORF Transcript_44876/g.79001 Transcript_44876/m.79001 type:complete len:105 (+) Transcript_44876:728-1042(+)